MIGKNTLTQTILVILSGIIGFFVLSFSARLFGPEVLGTFAYLLSLTGIIFAFSDLGFSKAHTFYTAFSKKPGHNLGTFLSLKTILLVLSSSVAFIYFYFIKSDSSLPLFGLVLIIQVLTRFSDAILITFEAKQISLPQNLIKLFTKAIRLLSVFLIAKIITNTLGYSLTYLVEASMLLLLSIWLTKRFLPLKFSRKLANKYLLYSLPFFAIVPLSYLQNNSLVIILRKFQSAEQVGYYSVSLGLAGSVKTLYATAMLYFFPKISKLFAQKDQTQIQNYLNMASKYLLVIFTPIFMLLFVFRQEVVTLVLGQAFIPAIPVFSLLLLGTYVLMVSAPYDQVLFATKNHRPLVMVTLFGLITAISLSFWLAPLYGAIGTVIASLTAWVFSSICHLLLVKKRLKLKLLPQLIPTLLPAVVLLLLLNQFQPLMIKLALSLLAVLIYYLTLWQIKIITKLDIKYIKSLIRP